MNNKANIVILTENELLKEEIVNEIRNVDYCEVIATFNEGISCESYLAKHTCDLLIVDLVLAQIDGVGIIHNVKSINQNAIKYIICMSDFTNSLVFDMLDSLSVDYCLKKPINLNYLMQIVKRVLKLQLTQDLKNKGHEHLVIKSEINHMFMRIGIPRHLNGYNYLVTATILVCNNINLLSEITKELYPRIARTYGTTASRVEQSIRHVLKCTWEKGSPEELERLFGYRVKCKPCNSEFISTIVDKLLSKYKKSD